jgi:hypothetical protein
LGGRVDLLRREGVTLDVNEEIGKRRTLRGDNRLPQVLMMGKRSYLRMMRGIVVAEDQMAGCVLPMVTIAEPCKSTPLHRERLANFKEGVVR